LPMLHTFKKSSYCISKKQNYNIAAEFRRNELSLSIVQCAHVEELVTEQENFIFKLAPRLDRDTVTFTNFNKMKVNKATNLYNRDVSGIEIFRRGT